MIDESLLEEEIGKLGRIVRVAIDASSIIYLSKSNALNVLAESVQLTTVQQVVMEAGLSSLPVDVAEIQDDVASSSDADTAILRCAEEKKIPVLSEDRKLLLRAENRGIPYYNSLMMIALLVLRGSIANDEIALLRDRLVEVAHYSRRILEYGDSLISHILMKR